MSSLSLKATVKFETAHGLVEYRTVYSKTKPAMKRRAKKAAMRLLGTENLTNEIENAINGRTDRAANHLGIYDSFSAGDPRWEHFINGGRMTVVVTASRD